MTILHQTITGLISLKKEGDYWDFKLKHHDNPVELEYQSYNDFVPLTGLNCERCMGCWRERYS